MKVPHTTTIVIVIPVFNEEANIHQVLSTITATLTVFSKFQFQILLVNDASTDNTSEEIVKFMSVHQDTDIPILLLEYEHDMGTAQTMLKLFQIAISQQPQLVIKLDMDLDFSHEEVLQKFLSTIDTDKSNISNTILAGIRVIPNEKVMTFYEQVRKKVSDIFLKEKLGLDNYDPVSGGTQLYPVTILRTLLSRQVVKAYDLRWGVDVLLPLLARKEGYQLMTIPMYESQYNLDRRKDSKVKMQYDAFEAVFQRVYFSG